jgi:hypothetical protein
MAIQNKKVSRVLGIAFLIQFVTSFSVMWIKSAWHILGDIQATMFKIAENPGLLQANVLMDMLTALGVIFLGVVLYITLRDQNEIIAFTALGFYILEGALLAVSKIATFSLLHLSQEFVNVGGPEYFLTLGNLSLESMTYVDDILLMLAFCVGGILFYYLLHKSRVVPPWLSLWGLITIIPLLIGTLAAFFNLEIPLIFFLPYLPFELVIGLWILVKGIPEAN